MIEIIEILHQEHRNIEKLLCVMEQELSIFDRGERPDYEVFGAIIEFFKKYPDACHHPKEDIIYEKFRARDPDRATLIPDLEAEHREGAVRLHRVVHPQHADRPDERVGVACRSTANRNQCCGALGGARCAGQPSVCTGTCQPSFPSVIASTFLSGIAALAPSAVPKPQPRLSW